MAQYLPPPPPSRQPAFERPVPSIAGPSFGRWPDQRAPSEPSLPPLDLRQILEMLRRRVWLILAITALGIGGAAYVAYRSHPVYSAGAVIRLTDSERQLTGGLADPARSGPLMSSDPVLSELAVLTSRAVVGNVIDSMPVLRLRTKGFATDLVRQFEIANAQDTLGFPSTHLEFTAAGVTATMAGHPPVEAGYGEPVDLGALHFVIASKPDAASGRLSVLPRADAAEALASGIQAKPRKGTDIIDVSYDSSDPVLAQRIINTLVSVFRLSSIADQAQEARLRVQFLDGQLHENDSLLAEARVAVGEFRSRQKSYSVRDKFTAEHSDLAALQARDDVLGNEVRLYTSVLQRLQEGKSRESLQDLAAALSSQGAAASPVVMDLYTQMQHLQGVRDSLTLGRWASAPSNPDVQRVDLLMNSTRARLKRTVQGILSTLAAERTALASQKAAGSATLVRIPATDVREAQLTEREAAFRKVADELRDELQKARLAEAAEVGQVAIVDLAMLPQVPIGTTTKRKIIFGLVFGLILGCGLALLLEHLNTSIRGRGDIETALHLPGLAVIPKVARRRSRSLQPWRRGTARPVLAKRPRDGAVARSLVAFREDQTAGAEAYKSLRAKLLFSQASGSLKTILVTSPFAKDGKSTVAANLATTFAQHGLRTLLVDCDLRRPTQHEIFHASAEPGLTELLGASEFLAGTGRRTAVDGLSLVTAGTLPSDPAELVGSARMRELLTKFAESFDVVVIDSPPVLPVADATVLASLADGVLLVVRAGQTNRRAAQLAVEQLRDVDARVLGAVLNDPKGKVSGYEAYGYSSYSSYYTR